MAKRTRLYGTRSRTDSRKTLTAMYLTARMPARCGVAARLRAGLGDPLDEKVLERLAQRVERDDVGARGGDRRQHLLGRLRERQIDRVAAGADLDHARGGRAQRLEGRRRQV